VPQERLLPVRSFVPKHAAKSGPPAPHYRIALPSAGAGT